MLPTKVTTTCITDKLLGALQQKYGKVPAVLSGPAAAAEIEARAARAAAAAAAEKARVAEHTRARRALDAAIDGRLPSGNSAAFAGRLAAAARIPSAPDRGSRPAAAAAAATQLAAEISAQGRLLDDATAALEPHTPLPTIQFVVRTQPIRQDELYAWAFAKALRGFAAAEAEAGAAGAAADPAPVFLHELSHDAQQRGAWTLLPVLLNLSRPLAQTQTQANRSAAGVPAPAAAAPPPPADWTVFIEPGTSVDLPLLRRRLAAFPAPQGTSWFAGHALRDGNGGSITHIQRRWFDLK